MIVNIHGVSYKKKKEMNWGNNNMKILQDNIELSDIVIGKGKNQEMSLTRAGDTHFQNNHSTF